MGTNSSRYGQHRQLKEIVLKLRGGISSSFVRRCLEKEGKLISSERTSIRFTSLVSLEYLPEEQSQHGYKLGFRKDLFYNHIKYGYKIGRTFSSL